ncbi:hypothetical protein ABVT39_026358 [Epinephelus coioides]
MEKESDMNQVDWGWKLEGNRFLPVMTNKTAAPESLLQMVHCNCTTTCQTQQCSCRAYGLPYMPACGPGLDWPTGEPRNSLVAWPASGLLWPACRVLCNAGCAVQVDDVGAGRGCVCVPVCADCAVGALQLCSSAALLQWTTKRGKVELNGREIKKRAIEEEAAKCHKLTDMFRAPPSPQQQRDIVKQRCCNK